MPVRYLTLLDVVAMNDEIVRRMGRTTSVLRDEGALDSALMRPRMAAHYESAVLVMQTVLLLAGIALAHAFVDGNKRTALAACKTFLRLNGFQVVALAGDLDDEFGRRIEALVTGSARQSEMTVDLVAWLRPRLAPVS
jgi:death on curing protein